MPTREQLIGALKQADAAGDYEAANRFAELIKQGEQPEVEPIAPTEPQYQGEPQGLDALSTEEVDALPQKGVGMARAVAQGVTLGFADEGEAGIVALLSNKTYKQARDEIRQLNTDFAEQNPELAIGANIVGGLATGIVGGAKVAGTKIAKTVGQKLATSTAGAAAAGGVTAAGFSEGETAGEVALDAGKGALIAAPFGFIGGGIGAYAANKAAKSTYLKNAIDNNPNGKVVKAMIKGGAKTEQRALMQQAHKQGLDDGVIGVIVGAEKEDRQLMRKMVNTYVKNQNNPKLALRNRPADVVGQSVTKRYKYVANQNKKAGEEINRISEQVLKGESVDYISVADDFLAQLDDAGVSLGDKGLDFNGSDFDPFSASQSLIKKVFKQSSTVRDANDVHKLKRTIDKLVTYGKTNNKSPDIDAERLVKGFRRELDGLLDGKFPEYDAANTIYAKTKGALDDVDSLLGKSTSVDSANFDKSVGTLARRISSNAMSGGRVDDAFTQLSTVADDLGGTFTDDFDSLVVFSNEFERRFPTQIRNSLQGQTSNAIGQAAHAANSPGTFTLGKIGEAYNAATGVSDEKALIALRRLLNQKN